MALSLLSVNSCVHPGCGLHFSSTYDLIAHIEYTHIPLTEQARQRTTSVSEREEARPNAPNLPLSCFQRVFATPYCPTPCTPEVFKISFNHYRKRNYQGNVVGANAPSSKLSTPRDDDNSNDAPTHDDLDECSINDHEMRFRCHYVDCNKRYKNGTGLRFHMKTVHGMATDDDSSNSNTNDCILLPNGTQVPQTPSPKKNQSSSRPHKCTQCSKRYKTVQGLQNHMQASHQKHPDANDSSSPSPAVVAQLITQARAHGLNQQAAQQQAIAEVSRQNKQREISTNGTGNSTPSSYQRSGTSLPQATTTHQYAVPNGALPVRSIQVQPNRVITQTHSMTTGQLLQQQIRDNRRMSHSKSSQHLESSTSAGNNGHINASRGSEGKYQQNQDYSSRPQSIPCSPVTNSEPRSAEGYTNVRQEPV